MKCKKSITKNLGANCSCFATQSKGKTRLLKIPHIFDTRDNAVRLKQSRKCLICCLPCTMLKGVTQAASGQTPSMVLHSCAAAFYNINIVSDAHLLNSHTDA